VLNVSLFVGLAETLIGQIVHPGRKGHESEDKANAVYLALLARGILILAVDNVKYAI
jgi:hypothetical protein